MLDKKPIIRTSHWRPGCVIPVGWVFENWKSKFLISNWQRKRCHRDRGAAGPWRKRCHRDRGDERWHRDRMAAHGASAAIRAGGRSLAQAWGLAARALPSGQGQALA